MHKVKDGSSVNTISNISTPRRSMNMGSFCSVMSNKSGSEFNRAIDISINSGSNLRRSSRVPKLINLESRDYESIAKPTVLKCNSSETDASVQSSIVLSIKNSCKLSQAAAKKSAKKPKVKFAVQKPNKPVLFKATHQKSKAKVKEEKKNMSNPNQIDKNETAADDSNHSVKLIGKKRTKNSNSTISNAVKERNSRRGSYPSTENAESCQGTNNEEKPKKKKVPVLPENEAIINSYVKYQNYFNETTLKNYSLKSGKGDNEEKPKSEEESKSNYDDASVKLSEIYRNDNDLKNDKVEKNSVKLSSVNNNSNNSISNNASSLEICSNKTIQSQTKLDITALKDLRCIKAKELNLSVSDALTGNRTISTMASLDMDIINSITHYRSYSNNSMVKSRSQSKNKKDNNDKKPTIFNIVKTNTKKPEKTKNRLIRKDSNTKSKKFFNINILINRQI